MNGLHFVRWMGVVGDSFGSEMMFAYVPFEWITYLNGNPIIFCVDSTRMTHSSEIIEIVAKSIENHPFGKSKQEKLS